MTLVDAIWEGPFVGELSTPDGRRLLLTPGVSEAQVSEADLESTHWRRKPKTKAAAAAKGADD